MDLHPLFVHFPVAFLGLYSVLELASFGRLARSRMFGYLKAFLAIIGMLSAFATLPTGIWAGLRFGANIPPVVKMHGLFASLTTLTYTILGASYTVRSLRDAGRKPWRWLQAIERIILNFYISKLLALLALGFITITGALGASIVYGPEIEPFVSFIYHLFFPR